MTSGSGSGAADQHFEELALEIKLRIFLPANCKCPQLEVERPLVPAAYFSHPSRKRSLSMKTACGRFGSRVVVRASVTIWLITQWFRNSPTLLLACASYRLYFLYQAPTTHVTSITPVGITTIAIKKQPLKRNNKALNA